MGLLRQNNLNLEHFTMQAMPSFTASGEQILSALPTLTVPPAPASLLWQLSSLSGPSSAIESLAVDGTRRERISGDQSCSGGCPTAEGIGLAHDAGNLLGAIRLYCDLLALPGVLRTEHRHYAEELRQLSARSGSLIDRLLVDRLLIDQQPRPETLETERRQAATQRARAKSSVEQVLLAEVVAACRGLLQTIAGTGQFLLAVEAGTEDYAVAVPRETVERILVNLTKNAVEAHGIGEERGTIAVRVRRVPGWGAGVGGGIALSVEDRGRGMTDTAIRRLLAEEVSSDCPTPRNHLEEIGPIRGIGFCVVRELVAATGGELRIRSRLGQGTTVEILWACTRDAGESG